MVQALKPIYQQVVTVMGASSGIGRATALEFGRQGAKVVVSARSKPGLESLVQEIRDSGGEAIAIPADVADVEQVKSVADQTVQQYGCLDTWVHLAATSVFAPFEQISPEEFRRVIEVNLMGAVYGAMAALPHLKRSGKGAFIGVSSVEARRSIPLQAPYSTAKHGMEGFLDVLRLELQHEGLPIHVVNVMPSTINTPFYNKTRTKIGVKPVGIPPIYEPELVANAIVLAAEHPQRDVIVGDSGKIVDLLQRLSPQLVDALLLLIAFPGQRTLEPKSADAPDNVFEPITGYDRVKGDFNRTTIPSFTDLLDQNPAVKWGAIATALVGAAALVGVSGRSEL